MYDLTIYTSKGAIKFPFVRS